MNYLPRDFIETEEGLLFAVVDGQLEEGRVLGFLRYGPAGKLSTDSANGLLQTSFPAYLHYSARLDASLHAVPLGRIKRHYVPRQTLQNLMRQPPLPGIAGTLQHLVTLLTQTGSVPVHAIGVTGSVLVGRQHPASDLDLVIYGRGHFGAARKRVRELQAAGLLQGLDESAWQEAYARRGCELGYPEYLWHEQRKGNKGVVAGVKFDLTLIAGDSPADTGVAWRKIGPATVTAKVLEDAYAFDHPARYVLSHPEFGEALSFTQTYAGQALQGECIEATGQAELSDGGRKRLVVGSSREALGEFIRVVQSRPCNPPFAKEG